MSFLKLISFHLFITKKCTTIVARLVVTNMACHLTLFAASPATEFAENPSPKKYDALEEALDLGGCFTNPDLLSRAYN